MEISRIEKSTEVGSFFFLENCPFDCVCEIVKREHRFRKSIEINLQMKMRFSSS